MKNKKNLLALLLTLCMILGMTTPAFAAAKASLKLNKSKVTVTVGKSETLKASVTGKSKKVTWKSSKPSIASVSSKGKVTGKKAGTAVITAKANGKIAKCTVTVKKEAVNYLKQGEYSKINAAPRPGSIGAGDFLIVQKLSSTKIKFAVEHYGVNGSPIYQTNVITAKLSNNKVSSFSWKDTWGNSGTGSLSFGKNKVTIKMNTKASSQWNRWGWYKSLTLPYKKSMTSGEAAKYLKNIG